MNQQSWDVNDVKFKEFLSCTPFDDIKSRNATATILSFLGYRHEIIPQMQRISHRSRAYIWNSDGLPGFLICDISLILQSAKKGGVLAAASKYQNIDYESLSSKLCKPKNYREKAKLKILKHTYPCLYVIVLEKLNKFQEKQRFMEESESFMSELPENYSRYVHGCFLPWLQD